VDMCGDGHGGLGEWLVNVDEKVTSYKHHIHAAKMLKLYNK
jgi:hypothetical protein